MLSLFISLLYVIMLSFLKQTHSLRHFRVVTMSTATPDMPMATISRIITKNSIPKAKGIESVKIKGWNCVAKIDEFNVGDLCIYFTIGSIFPENYEKTTFLKNKPLKTKKMMGVLSQGLVAPMNWLTDFPLDKPLEEFVEGEDVTSIFGVTKYVEPEEEAHYQRPGMPKQTPFPDFIPKTNEHRIQNNPEFLDNLKGKSVVITRKEDGSSATYIHRNGEVIVCSRNTICDFTQVNSNFDSYGEILSKYKIDEKLKALGKNIAIQGEIIGPKVNSNRLKLTERDFKVFNIYDIDGSQYYSHDEVEAVSKELDIPTVPVLYRGLADDCEHLKDVDSLLAFAAKQEYGPDLPAEGIVVKLNEAGPKMSFKAISNKYLLKYDL